MCAVSITVRRKPQKNYCSVSPFIITTTVTKGLVVTMKNVYVVSVDTIIPIGTEFNT